MFEDTPLKIYVNMDSSHSLKCGNLKKKKAMSLDKIKIIIQHLHTKYETEQEKALTSFALQVFFACVCCVVCIYLALLFVVILSYFQ